MKILLGDWTHVDFGSPVQMDDEQFSKFIGYLKSKFAVVEPEDSDDLMYSPRKRLGERKLFGMRWTPSELTLLLGTDSTEELMKKLARTDMSIEMYRGYWISDFNSWLAKNGYEIKGDLKELVVKYLHELEEEKRLARQARKIALILLECPECGLLHDPAKYDKKSCFMDSTKLYEIRVDSPEEKTRLCKNQPGYQGANLGYSSSEFESFRKKYCMEKD